MESEDKDSGAPHEFKHGAHRIIALTQEVEMFPESHVIV